MKKTPLLMGEAENEGNGEPAMRYMEKRKKRWKRKTMVKRVEIES